MGTNGRQSWAPPNPLLAAARERILARLDEASEVLSEAGGDLLRTDGGALERFRELLTEAQEHAEALTVASDATRRRRAQTVTRLAGAAITDATPVSEFLLVPFGDVEVERATSGGGFTFARPHAESAKRWFDRLGRKLAIDYEHQSLERFNPRPDGLSPAAGWIGGLEVRDDGLWATEVSWTERAADLLRRGEYRYFSPVIFWTDEDRSDVAGLGPVALTNDPAMRGVAPLAASRRAARPGAPRAGDAAGEAADEASRAELVETLRNEMVEAQGTIAALRRQLDGQQADAFVERGLRAGKIMDSTSMDWREDFLRDAEQAEARLARAPALLPPGRVVALGAAGGARPLAAARTAERELMNQWNVEAEDWEAYERAAAAGRVRQLGSA